MNRICTDPPTAQRLKEEEQRKGRVKSLAVLIGLWLVKARRSAAANFTDERLTTKGKSAWVV